MKRLDFKIPVRFSFKNKKSKIQGSTKIFKVGINEIDDEEFNKISKLKFFDDLVDSGKIYILSDIKSKPAKKARQLDLDLKGSDLDLKG